MLPRWHIFLGMVFTFLIWILMPETNIYYLSLVFLSSFMIDFDHYMCSVMKTGTFSLKRAFVYHKKEAIKQERERNKGIRRRGDFHLFHTLEFHALLFLIGIYFTPFLYIFIGMTFHSILDIFYLIYHGYLYRREFLFVNWIRKKF